MSIAGWIKAFFFPPRCPVCKEVLAHGEDFCPGCRERFDGMRAPIMRTLNLCPAVRLPCIAPFAYEGEIRDRLIEMKRRERRTNARLFSRPVAELVREKVPGWEGLTVTCVPGFEPGGRRYNPARVLARGVSRELGLPFLPDALLQPREKCHQHELGAADRKKNVEGLFLPGCDPVKGRRLLLVDDIVTTGATLCDCARALMEAGAEEVVCAAAASSIVEKRLAGGGKNAVEQTDEKVYTSKEGSNVG